MAAVLAFDVKKPLSRSITDANVPEILDPKTTAPVYLKGSFALIP